jgi:hypothetical protein
MKDLETLVSSIGQIEDGTKQDSPFLAVMFYPRHMPAPNVVAE